jgi:hypothetical protein
MWSRHSRRSEPMSRSAYAFCHGDLAAVLMNRIALEEREAKVRRRVERIPCSGSGTGQAS